MKLQNLLFALSIPGSFIGQNLVSNGDFEQYTKLPGAFAQTELATGWHNTRAQHTDPAPDYYNTDGSAPIYFGPMQPISGKGQMGLSTYHSTSQNFREYISSQLTSKMKPGTTYLVSFYLSNGKGNQYPYQSANFGVYFSEQPLEQKEQEPIEREPHCEITSVINLIERWQQYAFFYTPVAEMKYMTLGNFRTDAKTILAGEGNFGGAYYFIDKIEVIAADENTQLPENANQEFPPTAITKNLVEEISISDEGQMQAGSDELMDSLARAMADTTFSVNEIEEVVKNNENIDNATDSEMYPENNVLDGVKLPDNLYDGNLIPNGDFELAYKVPKICDQVPYAYGWSKLRGSPDFYHTEGYFNGWFGPIQPFSGKGQLGLCTIVKGNETFRECVQAKLAHPLEKGKKYELSFYVSNGGDKNEWTYNSGNLGAYFSRSKVKEGFGEPILLNPQCEIKEIIEADSTWKKYTFIYVAEDAMEYVSFGNFRSNSDTKTSFKGETGAYYFMDKIVLVPLSEKRDEHGNLIKER